MANVANKQMICNVLLEAAKTDKDIVVLCSDSRGSASATPFAQAYPEQFVEVGIAEQDLVYGSLWQAHLPYVASLLPHHPLLRTMQG